MSDTTLVVQRRETSGKNANRRTRVEGNIPAVVYGQNADPISVQVGDREIQTLLRGSSENAVFLLELEGTDQSRHVMVKEIQYDYKDGRLVHIDFQRIDMETKVRVNVAIELVGTPEGVKTEGGMIDFVNREIEIECLPGDIPDSLELNVEDLHMGQHLEAKDVELGEGRELMDDENKVLLSIKIARMAEVEAEEEEEEGVEGEDAAEAPADAADSDDSESAE